MYAPVLPSSVSNQLFIATQYLRITMDFPVPFIIDALSESCDHSLVGGKARNLWLLGKRVPASRVPDWYCVTTEAFTQFIQVR